jgi:hypothetical protein
VRAEHRFHARPNVLKIKVGEMVHFPALAGNHPDIRRRGTQQKVSEMILQIRVLKDLCCLHGEIYVGW